MYFEYGVLRNNSGNNLGFCIGSRASLQVVVGLFRRHLKIASGALA